MAHIQDNIRAVLGPVYGTTLSLNGLLKAWRATNGITTLAQEYAYYTGTGSLNDRMQAYWSDLATNPITDRAVAWWKAATYSGAGDLLDGSGNGHDLAITGAAFDTDRFVFVKADSDYMETADHADLDFIATDSFTIAIAMKIAAAPAGATSVWMGKRASVSAASVAAGWMLYSTNGSLVGRCTIDDATFAPVATKSGAFVADTKTLLVATRNVTADTLTCYSSGSGGTAATDTTTGTLANGEVLRIGRASGAATGYCDMTFYGAAIIRDEVLSPFEQLLLKTELGA